MSPVLPLDDSPIKDVKVQKTSRGFVRLGW